MERENKNKKPEDQYSQNNINIKDSRRENREKRQQLSSNKIIILNNTAMLKMRHAIF